MTPVIAHEITPNGIFRELDAYETACALADVHRWPAKLVRPRRPRILRAPSADRAVFGTVVGATLTVVVALCQIASAM